MDPLSLLGLEAVQRNIGDGTWQIVDVKRADDHLILVVDTEAREKPKTSRPKPTANGAAPAKRIYKGEQGRAELRDRVYDVLNVDGDEPLTTEEVGILIEKGPQATVKVLRELLDEGRVRETTGNKTKSFRWVRKPAKIHVGEGVTRG